ncbi:MAG: hypothetical protein UR98_C0003G0055 [Parcubacteria group bacterium GW2011_GWA1_36_12]|nr:MAG: hypothetical protein UR98_C0003G0055 [Parcubacteria group bacterium GW2011_GWA1_36_12]
MRKNYKLGQSLIEVVISIAIAAILAISLISTTLITQRTSQSARNNTEATKLAQEWVEQLRVFRDRHDFADLDTNACRLDTQLDPDNWALRGPICPVDVVLGTVTFHRSLIIEDLDSNKKAVTILVTWDESGGQREVKHETIFSDWESF